MEIALIIVGLLVIYREFTWRRAYHALEQEYHDGILTLFANIPKLYEQYTKYREESLENGTTPP